MSRHQPMAPNKPLKPRKDHESFAIGTTHRRLRLPKNHYQLTLRQLTELVGVGKMNDNDLAFATFVLIGNYLCYSL